MAMLRKQDVKACSYRFSAHFVLDFQNMITYFKQRPLQCQQCKFPFYSLLFPSFSAMWKKISFAVMAEQVLLGEKDWQQLARLWQVSKEEDWECRLWALGIWWREGLEDRGLWLEQSSWKGSSVPTCFTVLAFLYSLLTGFWRKQLYTGALFQVLPGLL